MSAAVLLGGTVGGADEAGCGGHVKVRSAMTLLMDVSGRRRGTAVVLPPTSAANEV